MESSELKISEYAQSIIQSGLATSRLWKKQGEDAWSALKKLGQHNLPDGDEIILAKNIYSEYAALKECLKEKGIKRGEFCEKIVTVGSSKELDRMMLAPDADPRRKRVRKSAIKYKNLLEGMMEVFDTDRTRFINRLMKGTSLRKNNFASNDEVDEIQRLLEAIVSKVDKEFEIFETFKETAVLKAAHAKKGGKCRWPQGDADWRGHFVPPQFWSSNNEVQNEIEAAQDVRFAYWAKPLLQRDVSFWVSGQESGCWMDDEFFHVLHAYLGYGAGIFFKMNYLGLHPGEEESVDHKPEQINEALEKLEKDASIDFATYGKKPNDEWDDALGQPYGQVSSMKDSAAHYHTWLIIYPSPDSDTVLPMLLIPCEEGGPFLIPLDSCTLASMRGNYWVDPDGTTEEFLERFKRIFLFRENDDDVLLQGLRRTAPWLKNNPFVKMKEKHEREILALRDYYNKLLSE